MEFIKVTTDQSVEVIADRLKHELADGKRVLWLISGGSNIQLAVRAMDSLHEKLTANLHITLTDERYGPVGHKDSNLQQLLDADFDAKNAELIPVLVDGLSLHDTADTYADVLASEAEQADVVIGQFGMGPDGHVAGIKPHSPAVHSADLVCAYKWDDYTRITPTNEFFEMVDASYLMVAGSDKQDALNILQHDADPDDQPAQFLKQIPESYVYNDYISS